MQLSIVNLTGSTKTYLSGTISIAGSGTTAVTSLLNQIALATDAQLRSDLLANLVQLSDTITTYAANDALAYLETIPQNVRFIKGGTDGTTIGNISDRLRTASTIYDGSGTELGTTANPLITTATLSFAPELLNGRLFSTSIEVNAATAGADNPLLLFRNPLGSAKNIFVYKVIVGISTANVAATFKLFAQPTTTNTTSTITNITQVGLSTTVTATTSGANGATVGAQFTITGTTNFNGTFIVASVISATVFTFTRAINLLTQTDTSGTVVMQVSLGTSSTVYPLKRIASPTAGIAIATSLPTLPANGSQLITIAQGQNTTPPLLVDSAQVSLEPGQNLVVTANPNSNNRSTTVTMIWSEVPQ